VVFKGLLAVLIRKVSVLPKNWRAFLVPFEAPLLPQMCIRSPTTRDIFARKSKIQPDSFFKDSELLTEQVCL